MGSIIEVFPRRNTGRLSRGAGAWRGAPVAVSGTARVRPARVTDYAAIRTLQRQAHSNGTEYSLPQLESQRHAFPEGQLVAERDGEVVGAASSLVVQWDDFLLDPTWKSVTGDGYFSTHDTKGRTLYGAEVVVDLARRGAGVGRVLFQAQRRLCRRLNLRRIISAVPLGGYHEFRDEMPPELYAQRVLWGDIPDAALRLQMSQGFQYCGIIHNYLPDDGASDGNAALIVWLNPFYSPNEPPANVDAERRRVA